MNIYSQQPEECDLDGVVWILGDSPRGQVPKLELMLVMALHHLYPDH